MIDNKYNDAKSNEFLEYLLHLSFNRKCADCGKNNPSWATINYGFFICYECSALHRGLGANKSKVKSIQMDSWSLDEIRRMYIGGNKNANKLDQSVDFITKYKNCSKLEKELDKLEADNKIREPGDSFMNRNDKKEFSHGKVNIQRKSKKKFCDDVSSENSEEIIEEVAAKPEKIQSNTHFKEDEENSEEKNLERIGKPTDNLKKSVRPSRSPFSFTIKEIEENKEQNK